jgi:ribose-phosphate pyrophosphokinase
MTSIVFEFTRFDLASKCSVSDIDQQTGKSSMAAANDKSLMDGLLESLGASEDFARGTYQHRHFPDGESYLRVNDCVEGMDVYVLCYLNNPNPIMLSLILFETYLRQLGARSVSLIAPYLPYMRQDKQFQAGEGIAAKAFATLVNQHFDGLITVDPHLHRIPALEEVYSIPCITLHASGLIADWLARIKEPLLLVGPDGESEQWVSSVAERSGHAFSVLQKVRHGDTDVRITLKDYPEVNGERIVFVDDMISTGRTMLAAAAILTEKYHLDRAPWAIAVHGVFSGDALAALKQHGFEKVLCSDSIPIFDARGIASNELSLAELIAAAVLTLKQRLT